MWKKKAFSILKKIGTSLIFTLFLSLLALFPNIGYHGKTSFLYFEERYLEHWIPYRIITLSCDVTLNPIVYPVSWLTKESYISGKFQIIYHPQSYGSQSDLPPYYPSRTFWGSHEDMEQEALMGILLSRLFSNTLFLFVVVFFIEMFGRHELLLCLLFGVVGFALASSLGALIGLVVGIVFVIIAHRIRMLEWLQEKIYAKEEPFDSLMD